MIFIFALLQGILLQTSTSSCASNLGGCFSGMYVAWFALAAIAALAVLCVLAIIYGLSPWVGRSDIRTWVRVKIYDVCLSLVLIFVFLWVAGIVYNFNVGFLAQSPINLVPSECSAANSAGFNPTSNIYSLAICDMYQFNVFTATLNTAQYYFTLAAGTLQPNYQVEATFGSVQIGGPVTLLPKETGFKYLGTVVDLVYSFVLANDVQLILLSASALIFSILMSLGLIARVFTITRTFGGAMIAFAIGIGIIYPILVIANYGFINYGLDQIQPYAMEVGGSGTALGILNLAPPLVSAYTGSGVIAAIFRVAALGADFGTSLPEPTFIYVGLVWIGLTFIPLINLIIVDVFIIDFSQAIGERLDLLSMLERIL